jgi:hypothetical protein
LNSIGTIIDVGSTYQNNSANTGGVYYIVGKTLSTTSISISKCDFLFSYGTVGGVFALYDTFNASISNCNFINSRSTKGGAIMVSELYKNILDSNLRLSSNIFENSSSSGIGGVIWLSHVKLSVTIDKNKIYKSTATTGGVFYIS